MESEGSREKDGQVDRDTEGGVERGLGTREDYREDFGVRRTVVQEAILAESCCCLGPQALLQKSGGVALIAFLVRNRTVQVFATLVTPFVARIRPQPSSSQQISMESH